MSALCECEVATLATRLVHSESARLSELKKESILLIIGPHSYAARITNEHPTIDKNTAFCKLN